MSHHFDNQDPDSSFDGPLFLIEDVKDIRESFTIMLELCGCTVVPFENGKAALEQLDAVAPRAAIIDLEIPLLNGFELVQRIRQLPKHQDMVLAALTGDDEPGTRDKALNLGFDLFFKKPTSVKTVYAEIQRLIAFSQPKLKSPVEENSNR